MDVWAIKYQLLNSSPEYVFDWLKLNTEDGNKWSFISDERESLEEALLSQNNKLINLGLALFCLTPSIGLSLYNAGDHVIKKAALSGLSVKRAIGHEEWILNESVIPHLLQKLTKGEDSEDDVDSEHFELMRTILTNKNIADEVLTSLYKKDAIFSNIDDDLWLSLLFASLGNERITTPYAKTVSYDEFDGLSEWQYNRLFTSAWQLFETLPVTRRNVLFLSMLSSKVVPEAHGINVPALVEKWAGDDEESFCIRNNLVKTIGSWSDNFKSLKDNSDLAVRCGYYENMHFPSLSDFQSYLELDGEHFLRSATCNDEFYAKEDVRDALHEACRANSNADTVFSLSDEFSSRLTIFKARRPELFFDCESDFDLPFDDIKNDQERMEVMTRFIMHRLSKVDSNLKELLEREDNQEERRDVEVIVTGKNNKMHAASWGWIFAIGICLWFFLRN